jgi:hypothetical protein
VKWTYLFAVLVVAGPILVVFAPALCSDRSFAVRDAAHFYHPLLEWTSRQWLRGEVPLWNPLENNGVPLAADASSALFYPGRVLLFAPIDFTWRYKFYIVGHAILAAFGSYRLARHWRASPPAGVVAAVAYACGGSVLFQYANVVFLVGAAWLPLAAWATDRMLGALSWRAAITLGVVVALMTLGGDPQMAYHVLLAAGLYAVVRIGHRGREATAAASTPAPGHGTWASRLMARLSLVALAAGCGLGLAAVQILPSREAAQASERAYWRLPRNVYEAAAHVGAGKQAWTPARWREAAEGLLGQPEPTTHHDRAYDFSLPPWRLVETVWPNVGGRMFPTHRRWLSLIPGDARVWTPTIYLGVVPLVLALSQWRIRRAEPHVAWLSWLLLAATLASFGSYGLGWCIRQIYATAFGGDPFKVAIGSPVGGLYWLMVTLLPSYVQFRYPAKLLIIAALAASQLAAGGFDRALSTRENQVPRAAAWVSRLAVASIVLLVVCWLGLSWLGRQLEGGTVVGKRVAEFLDRARHPSLGPFDLAGAQRDVYLALAHTAAVCGAAAWIWRQSRLRPSGPWPWTLAMLTAIDLVAANYWLVQTAPSDHWRMPPPAVSAIFADRAEPHAAAGPPRVFRASINLRWQPPSFSSTPSAARMAEIAAWERDTLFPKYGLNHGISLVESYGSLKPVDYESLFVVARSFGPAVPNQQRRELPHPAVLRLLRTEYLVLPSQWQPVQRGKPFATRLPPSEHEKLADDMAIWRLDDPLPRVWIVHEAARLAPLAGRDLAAVDERTRDVLFPLKADGRSRSVRDFRNMAVVETDLPLELPQQTPPGRAESCRIRRYELHAIEIEATLAAPGLVVLSDLYAPGWVATAESGGRKQPLPVLRTNRVCRGVWLPAGQHVVRFEYRPAGFVRGTWISLAAWLAAGAALLAVIIKGRPWRKARQSG